MAQQGPTELCLRYNGNVELSWDRLSAKFVGKGKEMSALNANQLVPRNVTAFYFEMLVINAGTDGLITIGFLPEAFKPCRQPGWDANSFGYSHIGKKYSCSDRGEDYGPTYTAGDVVGAGVILSRQEIFFTKNGNMLPPTALKCVKVNLYPAVSLCSSGEEVSVNFGEQPFVFNLGVLIAEERESLHSEISKIPIPYNTIHHLVRDFLIHNAHVDTLAAFNKAVSYTAAPTDSPDADQAHIRKQIRAAIMSQDTPQALELVGTHFSTLQYSARFKAARLHLQCQRYVDLLLTGDVNGALEHGQRNLKIFRTATDMEADLKQLLHDTLAMIAYSDVSTSPMQALQTPAHRRHVADVVNSAILNHLRHHHTTTFSLPQQQLGEASTSGAQDAIEGEADDLMDKDKTQLALLPNGGIPSMDPVPTPVYTSQMQTCMQQLQIVQDELYLIDGKRGEEFELSAMLQARLRISHDDSRMTT